MSWIPESPDPRILGVDPGSLVTGWGLIGVSGGRTEWLDAGVIRLGRTADGLALRLCKLQSEIDRLVQRLQPTCSAVEAPFQGVNPRSALQLAHSRGVVLAVLAAHDLEVHEYSPATVKKSVTGNGRAPKDQVRTMVGHLLRQQSPPQSLTDLTDALAVALCHASHRRFKALAAGSERRAR